METYSNVQFTFYSLEEDVAAVFNLGFLAHVVHEVAQVAEVALGYHLFLFLFVQNDVFIGQFFIKTP